MLDPRCPKCNFKMIRIPIGNYQDKDFDHEYVIFTKCINPFCKKTKKEMLDFICD